MSCTIYTSLLKGRGLQEHLYQFNAYKLCKSTFYYCTLYKKYLLDKLKEAKDKVTYTIDFTVHKSDGKWKLDSINDTIEDKILGIYNYND